ncbi:ecto-ADP-ribosyltransferase 5-like isoform X2 [Aquarana catesbeiana]|uniref:ecto-ADP-ribosyltransferase 5-like isoform X2 n=2 Tax=Aquarana catesbeiana TaxID=8400 RepID=UPI003CC94B38
MGGTRRNDVLSDYCRMRSLVGILFSVWLIFGLRQTQALYLTMSDTAFDDQYEGCTEEMESRINSLLAKEKEDDSEFSRTWDAAEKKWNTKKRSVPSGFRDEYGIAIMAYSNNETNLYKDFNSAVRNYSSWDTFRYHSLHFLMTRAVVLLRSSCWWSPWSVYRGMKYLYFEPEKIGGEVRLGQFSSSSTSQKIAKDFGDDTFFTFTSCFGAQIKKYSYYPDQEEVLIPVDEVFTVTNFTKQGGKNRFVLKTTKRRCHYYNCDYLRKGGKSNTCVTSGGTRIFSSLALIALLALTIYHI